MRNRRKVLLKEAQKDTVQFSDLNITDPIFAEMDGILRGMIVQEDDGRWILMLGGKKGATGRHGGLLDCLKSCESFGYEFSVN